MARREPLRVAPVRRHLPPRQAARRREQEDAAADRDEPRARPRAPPPARPSDGSPFQLGHDDRVGVRQRLEPVLDHEREPARGRRQHARVLGAQRQLVPPRHVELRPLQPEDLDHDPELERRDPRRRAARRPDAQTWPDLDACRHSGHWSIVATLRRRILGMNYFAKPPRPRDRCRRRRRSARRGAFTAPRLPQRARLRRRPHPRRDLPRAAPALDDLPAGPLVVYCWGPGCNGAVKACARLYAARPHRRQGDARRLRVLGARGLRRRGRARRASPTRRERPRLLVA